MNRIVEELKRVKLFFVATVDGDQPRVRPFSSIAEYENHAYLCTGLHKEIYNQISKNPKVEISGMYDGGSWIRISAVLVEDNREEVQRAVLEDPTGPSQLYQVNDGRLVCYKLTNIKALKFNFYAKPEEIEE